MNNDQTKEIVVYYPSKMSPHNLLYSELMLGKPGHYNITRHRPFTIEKFLDVEYHYSDLQNYPCYLWDLGCDP